MDTVLADIRQAHRGFRRAPAFVISAVGILALGIAANTTVFSVANAVLFRPLPYEHPEQLVVVNEIIPRITNVYPMLPVNARHFYTWKERARSFADMAIFRESSADITAVDGEPEHAALEEVSFNLLAVLGVRLRLGRNFTAAEDHPGNNRVVILTEALWRRFRSDPGILNKTIQLDGVPHKVIGVLPASFRLLHFSIVEGFDNTASPPELFKPIAVTEDRLEEVQGDYNYKVIGRLRIGVTREQALAEMNAMEAALNQEFRLDSDLRAALTPLQENVVAGTRRGLLVLLASVSAVLLIVCVNLGNLMLARAAARAREIAVRTALGAGQWRIVRQFLTESLMISLSSGLVGVVLTYAAVQAFVTVAPVNLPRLDEVHLDTRALLFAFGVSMLAGLLFALVPSWRAGRSESQDALRFGGRSTEDRQSLRISEVLIVAEVALSVGLLVAAGLLVASLTRILGSDQGFHADNVLAVKLNLSASRYNDQNRVAFIDRLVPTVQALPGVRAAATISTLPLQGKNWGDMITREDDHRPVFQRPLADYRVISPEYFRAMGIRIIQGRPFEPSDHDREVEIVSARTAARIWPGENPIGKRIRRGNDTESFAEVIGVAADTRTTIGADSPLMVYRPYWKTHNSGTTRNFSVVIQTAQNPTSAATALRSAIRAIDSELPVPEMVSMKQVIDVSVAHRRFQTMLLGAFALAALLLAVIGIYGVISYTVNRRRNEIGIRMALGARPRHVAAMVLRQGMRPVAIGLLIGLLTALTLGRFLGALLYEIRPNNPAVLAIVAATLTIAAALACYIPALRATAVDPASVVRCE